MSPSYAIQVAQERCNFGHGGSRGLARRTDTTPVPRPPTTPNASGPFGVVLQACRGDPTRCSSEPTELPATLGALERGRAGSALVRRMVTGADPGDLSEPGLEVSGRIADLAVTPGSEANLAPAALEGLGRWLRSSEGFDEVVARRCKRADAFGFRLWRQVPPLDVQGTELTVDFHCHSLVVVDPVGRQREVRGAHFDGPPRRPAHAPPRRPARGRRDDPPVRTASGESGTRRGGGPSSRATTSPETDRRS
jgi:hypothetical protein